jgi:hypothetical protein
MIFTEKNEWMKRAERKKKTFADSMSTIFSAAAVEEP